MNETPRVRDKSVAALFAVVLHVAVVVLLYFVVLPRHEAEELGGVFVNIGEVDMAQGTFTPDPQPLPTPPPEPTPPAKTEADPLLTQESEEAPVVPSPKKPNPVEEKKPVPPKENPEEVARKREAEARRRAEEERVKREQEEQKRRDAIGRSVSGAFSNAGQGSSQGSGTAAQGKGTQGSPEGNAQQGEASSGVGGMGSVNLSGRSLMGNGLPRPSYSSEVEGTIVIKIVVDPSGKVISSAIAPGTNITDYNMRQSALKAATSARFNSIESITNQTGTITYRYRLR